MDDIWFCELTHSDKNGIYFGIDWGNGSDKSALTVIENGKITSIIIEKPGDATNLGFTPSPEVTIVREPHES